MRTRLVLDTNVFVAAAFNRESSSAHILDGIRAGRWELVWSQATRAETRSVFRQIPPLDWELVTGYFRPDGERFAEPRECGFSQIADPDDRPFAALAAAADAVLVTNDDHLLSVRGTLDMEVRTPGEFVATAATQKPDPDPMGG